MVEQCVPDRGGAIDFVGLAQYSVRLRKPWFTAKGHRAMRQGWLITLGCGKHCGYGDCAPWPEMGTESLAVAGAQLRAGLKPLFGLEPFVALSKLDRWLHTPAARCALETALADLLARRADLPLARWLNRSTRGRVAVNSFLGGIDDALESRAQKTLEEGFKILKIKLGLRSLSDELLALRGLAATLGRRFSLRLDANGAWDEPTARQALDGLRDLPVEALEEPLAAPRPENLQRLQRLVPWPLALDESLHVWPLQNLVENPPVKRLVLKPMILGGLLPSLRLAKRAAGAGLECVVTTTVDSAAGVWAALHLACALDNDLAHGLNTSVWLAEDIGLAPTVQNAHMMINEMPGLGFAPFTDRIDFKAP